MNTLKHLLVLALVGSVATSCYTEINTDDDVFVTPLVTLDQRLDDYEVWYVDLNRSTTSNPIPFMQKAFTLSFLDGTFYANNNIAGLGNNGDGFGLDVGFYGTFDDELDLSHDLDGTYTFIVHDRNAINEIELYNPETNSRYVLIGYQRDTFDYDLVFYDNIHYFLQEYETWEKIFTSDTGEVNPFDEENFLQFLPAGANGNFRSSIDSFGTPVVEVVYDYEGIYDIDNISGTVYQKTLTLDYNFPDNEVFELTVINDNTIELYQYSTETIYRFRGRGYIQFKTLNGKSQKVDKMRKSDAEIKKEIQALIAKKKKALKI